MRSSVFTHLRGQRLLNVTTQHLQATEVRKRSIGLLTMV
jgi:hypothetical protein